MNKIQPKTYIEGKNTIYLPSCHSTNEMAMQIIQNDAVKEDTIVITDNQTRGKGQRGNSWETQKGKNLTFSLILQPYYVKSKDQFAINLAVSLGIFHALLPILGEKLKIKWPNDIFYDRKKIGGVLIENMLLGQQITYTVVGIGLNINQTSFNYPLASSLKSIKGRSYDRYLMLKKIDKEIDNYLVQLRDGNTASLLNEFSENLFLRNKVEKFSQDDKIFEGKIEGVNADGQLIMSTADGEKLFGLKEFKYII